MPAAYRDRLLLEGSVLAAAGAAGSAVLLAKVPEAKRWPPQTIGQLAGVAVLLLWPATRRAQKDLASAPLVAPWRAGTGEPTPVWHVPVPVVLGALYVAPVARRTAPTADLRRRAGWDAALRVTGGSLLVGLWQALVLRREVQQVEGWWRTAVRLRGSRLGRTKVGFVPFR